MGLVVCGFWRRWMGGIRVCLLPVDQILAFADADKAVLGNLVVDPYDGQIAAAPGFQINRGDGTGLFGGPTQPERMQKNQPPACPHPAGQAAIRDEIASLRMAVTAKRGGRCRFPEMQVVPEWRQRIAGLGDRSGAAKRSMQSGGTGRVQRVGIGACSADGVLHGVRIAKVASAAQAGSIVGTAGQIFRSGSRPIDFVVITLITGPKKER